MQFSDDFDILEFLELKFEKKEEEELARGQLSSQAMTYSLLRLIEEKPELEEKVKQYFNEFKQKLKEKRGRDGR